MIDTNEICNTTFKKPEQFLRIYIRPLNILLKSLITEMYLSMQRHLCRCFF